MSICIMVLIYMFYASVYCTGYATGRPRYITDYPVALPEVRLHNGPVQLSLALVLALALALALALILALALSLLLLPTSALPTSALPTSALPLNCIFISCWLCNWLLRKCLEIRQLDGTYPLVYTGLLGV